jgi:hypothetical protein
MKAIDVSKEWGTALVRDIEGAINFWKYRADEMHVPFTGGSPDSTAELTDQQDACEKH